MNGCDGNQLGEEIIGFIMSEDCNKGSARRAKVGTGKQEPTQQYDVNDPSDV